MDKKSDSDLRKEQLQMSVKSYFIGAVLGLVIGAGVTVAGYTIAQTNFGPEKPSTSEKAPITSSEDSIISNGSIEVASSEEDSSITSEEETITTSEEVIDEI